MDAPTPSQGGIPRGRLIAVLVVGAVAAAVVVGLASLAADEPAPEAIATAAQSATIEPLPGTPGIALPPDAGMPTNPAERLVWAEQRAETDTSVDAQLRLAEAQLATGDPAAARVTLAGLDDPRATVAGALVAYDPADPATAIGALAAEAEARPADTFARFSLGVALLWSGRRADAEAELRRVRAAEPESYYGVAADDLLHPAMAPGYPPFIPAQSVPAGDLSALAAAASARPDDAVAQIAHATALLSAGRRTDAIEAFDAALAVEPGRIEAQVGRIMAGFAKATPESAFGQIGPLVRDNPDDPSPRLHLAMLLLWLRDVETARAQLRLVAEQHPGTRLGDAAKRFLAAL